MLSEAIVTDVQVRGSLAGLRGLGRAGVRTLAVAPGPTAAGLWSRYASERALAPSPDLDPAAFALRIAELARRSPRIVVYPGGESAIDALLDPAVTLPESALIPYPGSAPLQLLRDKALLSELARAAGLRTPATLVETTGAELARSPVGPPYLLKPAKPGRALLSSVLVQKPADLDALLARLPPAEKLLLQERIGGRLIGLALVISREASVVARFQQVAHRTWPLGAGVSSFASSVAPDEQLTAAAARMLIEAGFWGLAHLQFIDSDGARWLIDVNPRFYGSLPLASGAGVNLPAAWHAVALGRRLPTPGPYQVGLRYRWLEGEVLVALRGRQPVALLPARRPRVGAAWAPDDPVPGALLIGQRLRERRARLSGNRKSKHPAPSSPDLATSS